MNEQEYGIEELKAAAETEIEGFFSDNNPQINKADRIMEAMSNVIMASNLDQEQKSKILLDMSNRYTGLRKTYEAATTEVQKADAMNIISIEIRNYLESLEKYK